MRTAEERLYSDDEDEPDGKGPNKPNGAGERPKGKTDRPPLESIWADQIEIDVSTESGTIDGVMAETGLGVLYGESGSAKTFCAVDMACHVAAGLPWRGHAVEQGVVVYIAAEAPTSVQRRIRTWKDYYEVEHLPVLVIISTVDLLHGSTGDLVERLNEVRRTHGRIALVVVDTLACAMVGNENAPDDMGAFVAACRSLRDAADAFVLVVHHSGKDTARGARGHSSLRAATDLEMELTLGDGGGCLKMTKTRDEAGGYSYGFRLHRIELGENANGRMVTTCVVLAADAPAKADAGSKLNARQKVVLDCLDTATADHGQPSPGTVDIPSGVIVVTYAHWCSTVLRYTPAAGAEDFRRREQFGRAVDFLQAKGLVKHVDGWCWRKPRTEHRGPSHPSHS